MCNFFERGYTCGHTKPASEYCANATVDNNTGRLIPCEDSMRHEETVDVPHTKCPYDWCNWTGQVWQCHECGEANVLAFCNNYILNEGDDEARMCMHLRCKRCRVTGGE